METIARIENKLDKIIDHLSTIDVTLAAKSATDQDVKRRLELAEAQLEPVRRHVARAEGAAKLVALAATVVAIAGGIAALMK